MATQKDFKVKNGLVVGGNEIELGTDSRIYVDDRFDFTDQTSNFDPKAIAVDQIAFAEHSDSAENRGIEVQLKANAQASTTDSSKRFANAKFVADTGWDTADLSTYGKFNTSYNFEFTTLDTNDDKETYRIGQFQFDYRPPGAGKTNDSNRWSFNLMNDGVIGASRPVLGGTYQTNAFIAPWGFGQTGTKLTVDEGLTLSGATGNVDLSSSGNSFTFNGVSITSSDEIDMGTNNITDTKVGNWDTAYGWGDHGAAGYLTTSDYGDTDVASYLSTNGYDTASNIIADITDSAPATLDTLNELAAALGDDPNYATTTANSIATKWTQDNTKISNWDTAYGWGDHSTAGYLTSFTETNDLSTAVTWANVPDANITESSVTQHQAALSITESQISDFGTYLTAETNDLSAAVTWANVPDANITESSVTQHQSALSVTESQISDFGDYEPEGNALALAIALG